MMSSGVTDQEPTVVQPLFREPVNIGEWVELVVVVVLLHPSKRGLVRKRGCTYRGRPNRLDPPHSDWFIRSTTVLADCERGYPEARPSKGTKPWRDDSNPPPPPAA